MLKAIDIAQTLVNLIVGSLVPAHILRKMDAGRVFTPQTRECISEIWYPKNKASAVASRVAKSGA